ncbi:MAG: M48 family metalloprotease [Leptolyngbyaceae cyanobacterium]
MKIGKRFLIWGVVGLFLSTGLNGFGNWVGAVWAAEPAVLSALERTAPAIAHNTESDRNSADDLQLPEDAPSEATTDAENAEDAEDRTLDLPDFEPRLPGETVPEQSGPDAATESDETTESGESSEEPNAEDSGWTEGEVESSEEEPPKISKQQQILITADEHYLAGDYATAEMLYRQVKDNLWQVNPTDLRPEPIFDPAELPPAGAVYWREAQAGYEQGLTHRTTVPLDLLVEAYPEFVPGQVFYANYLVEQGRAEEADAMLDRALLVYPSQPDLLKARTYTQMALEQWIEASISARQFTLLNPDHADFEEMATLSQENLDRFRGEMNEEITGNFIGNLVTGAAGVLLTGGLIGPYTALNSAMLLLQGESAVGATTAEQVKAQAPMMSDRQVDEYLNTMGQKLASLAGRDEFDYDFYVIDDPALNAFALPGGKIFINSGAILKTNSEAELAGLLSHELSHAVLSHGFQMATNGNLVNSIASIFPVGQVGGIAAGLAFSSYSRQMERQADVLGTQILATAGYAADGLHNLMVTLEEETGDRGGLQWFASHPAPTERVEYLRQIVEAGGYNRYAYEGVATHLAIQQRVARLMDEPPDETEEDPTEIEESDE